MVTEAVAELKGEPVATAGRDQARAAPRRQPPARLRARKEELRLEAYRRLAAVTTEAEVDDIRAEWLDRYGPVPPAAEALLAVARLRAECVRTGVREVTVTKAAGVRRCSPYSPHYPRAAQESQTIRLGRLYKGAVYKEATAEVQVPLRGAASTADEVIEVLTTILPPTEAETATVVPQGAA